MHPVHLLLQLAGQEPAGGLLELLDKGPLGLSVILMGALFWLFRYYEGKLERQRSEHRDDWNKVREDQTKAMQEQAVAIVESNRLGAELVQHLKGE